MASTGKDPVERSRITRVGEVLSNLFAGEVIAERITIDVCDDDAFAATEAKVNQFSRQHIEVARENERLQRERLETIERQRVAISNLSTPIIDLWDNIITLPIVGVVDSHRSLEMTERLLERISSTHVKCVIIDVTGVDVVDTMTADHLLKMVHSAQLLGSYCVVTGISPSVAQTLVQLEVDLERLATLRDLKAGLKACFRFLMAGEDD